MERHGACRSWPTGGVHGQERTHSRAPQRIAHAGIPERTDGRRVEIDRPGMGEAGGKSHHPQRRESRGNFLRTARKLIALEWEKPAESHITPNEEKVEEIPYGLQVSSD